MGEATNYSKKAQEIMETIDFDKHTYEVSLKTTAGDIHLELYPQKAPLHCKNFIALAQSGFYNNLQFHRVIKDFMVQTGCPHGTGTGGPGYTIDAEFNETPHELGTLSMARAQDPNSAGSQFFICLAKHEYLDGQYTAFGKISKGKGISVIQKIAECETDAQDKPLEKITILQASVNKS